MKTIDDIANDFAIGLLAQARANNLQWKDVRSPAFERNFAVLREQIADWLEANMETKIQLDGMKQYDGTAVAAGRAA